MANYDDDEVEKIERVIRQKRDADKVYNEARNKGFQQKANNRLKELIVEVVNAFFGSGAAELIDRLLKRLRY